MRARSVAFSASQSWQSPSLYSAGFPLFPGFFSGGEKITEFVPRCIRIVAGGLSTAKKVIESGLGSLCLSPAAWAMRLGTRLVPVAETRAFLVPHLPGALL